MWMQFFRKIFRNFCILHEIIVAAKDGADNEITVTDAGAQGVFVESENAQSVVLEITVVKKDIPWGLTALWESLVR